jgi:ABC-2 type transport system permease protein
MTTVTRPQPDVASAEPVDAPRRAAWPIVMRREILVKLTDKGFIVGTLVTVAILAAWLGWNAYQAERTSTYAVVTTAADAPMAEALAASWPPRRPCATSGPTGGCTAMATDGRSRRSRGPAGCSA